MYNGDLIITEQLLWQRDTDKERGLQREGAALVRWVLNVHWGTPSSHDSLTSLLSPSPCHWVSSLWKPKDRES